MLIGIESKNKTAPKAGVHGPPGLTL